MKGELSDLHAALDQIVMSTHSMEGMATSLLGIVGHAFRADVGMLWIVDQRIDALRCEDTWHVAALNARAFEDMSRHLLFSRGSGLPGQVWEMTEPVWIPDLEESTHFLRLPLASDAGLRSGFAFPLAHGGDVHGMIELFWSQDHAPSQGDRATLVERGQQIAYKLEPMLAQRAVQHSGAYTAAILDAALDAIVTIDHQGHILAFNPAAERLFCYRRDDVIGQQLGELLVPPALRAAHYAGLARYLQGGEPLVLGRRVEITAMCSDEREIPVELSITQVPDVRPPLFTGYIRDLREFKEREARQQFLAKASEVLSASLDLEQTLAEVARLSVSFLADWCVVYLQDDDGRIERVAVETADTANNAIAHQILTSTRIDVQASHGVPEVIRSGTSLLLVDAAADDLIGDVDEPHQLRAVIEPRATHSWMCVPLSARDRTFGAISFIAIAPRRQYDAADLYVAEELARRAALAIDNARLYQEADRARHEARLHAERVEALAAASRAFAGTGLELQPLFETIAGRIAAVLHGLCIVRLLSVDGLKLEPVAISHPDPDAADAMRDLAAGTSQGATEGLLGWVIEHRASLLIAEWASSAHPPEYKPEFQPYVERFGLHSVLVVPLIGRESLLGTIGVFRDTPGHPFTHDDQSFLEDLAGRAALAVENARLYGQVRDALTEREAFVSVAAHELRTPLTTIKAYGQLLERALGGSDIHDQRLPDLMGGLGGQIARMERLVNDLLDAARLQQQPELRRERVDLVALVQSVLERFEHDLTRTSRHVVLLDAEMPVVGEWDASRIDQVVTNLVSNALKYSPGGGEVRVTVRRVEDQAEVEVCDQGIGITCDEQQTLFRPFSRGSATFHGIPGTGLGLYLTSQIVERHGGTISVRSTPGSGSTFRVSLPFYVE